LPLAVILPSVFRGIPALYKWRIRMRVIGWYRDLLDIERKLLNAKPEERRLILEELDSIESRVNKNVPTSFADQFYALRGYIHFVRARVVLD
ncbi:MAG TPA: C4-dicarboxylate ABC transporter substrate-binding protein, partial [Spirochaetota bacterium]